MGDWGFDEGGLGLVVVGDWGFVVGVVRLGFAVVEELDSAVGDSSLVFLFLP